MKTSGRRPAGQKKPVEDDVPWHEAGGPGQEAHIYLDPLRSREDLDYIQNLTTKNLRDMPFPKFLEILSPFVLERVPEGIMGNADALHLVDQQIGRFANLYAYLSVLFSFASSEARRIKPVDKGQYDSMMAKKDALYRLLQAVELKWRACSRQVTVETEGGELEFERPNYKKREERATSRRGWDAVE